MKNLFTYLFLAVYLLIPGITHAQEADLQHQKDSIRHLIAVSKGADKFPLYKELCFLNYPESEIDTLLGFCHDFLREAQVQQDTKSEATAREFELAFLFNYDRHDVFFKKVYQHMKFFKDHDFLVTYYTTYRHLLEIYFSGGESEKALTEAEALYEEAKADKYPYGIASATYIMALIHVDMGHTDEAETYYRETLDILKGSRELLVLEAYYRLAALLIEREAFDETSSILAEWRQELGRIEKEGTVHGALWNDYYQTRAQLSLAKKTFDEAGLYCDSIEMYLQDGRAYSELYYIRAVIATHKGRDEEALELVDKALYYVEAGGNLNHSVDFLREKGRILCKLGKGEWASQVYDSAFVRGDSLRDIKYSRQLGELRTRYEVDKHMAETRLARLQLIIAAGGCVLLLVILILYIRYSHRLKMKNRALYEQIQEKRHRAEEARKVIAILPEEGLSREMQLFRSLEKVMETEQLFTTPDIDRKALAARLNTNERYLADAIREGTGLTVSAYLTRLRLEYAVLMMETHPHYTMNAIASDAGFVSYDPFLKAFVRTYGMTPSDYRKLAKQKEN